MGLMDIISKVGPIAGMVAAPFTGGLSIPAGAALGALGTQAGAAAEGMAKERGGQNQFGVSRGQLANQQYGIGQNARTDLLGMQEKGMLDRAKLGIEAPTARANQVLKGSLMELLQPAKVSSPRANMPTITGGLTPDVLSKAARQAGVDLQGIAGQALRTGSDVPAMPDYVKQGTIEAPELPEYQDPGGLETGLGVAGSIGKIIEALSKQGVGADGPARTPTPGAPAPPPVWDPRRPPLPPVSF